jgi:hypothetical protein
MILEAASRRQIASFFQVCPFYSGFFTQHGGLAWQCSMETLSQVGGIVASLAAIAAPPAFAFCPAWVHAGQPPH